MPFFDLSTKVALVIHRREQKMVSATGPLAMHCLANSETFVHGNRDFQVDLNVLNSPDRRLLFLYPGGGAKVLSPLFLQTDDRPVTLIVPDGNWNQAGRMAKRLKGIEHAEFVTLPEGERTRWGLRKEIREYGLATFEAIARALGIIESPLVQKEMEEFFMLTVDRVKKLRGRSIYL
jgi:DTW domain-containing protein YfiP